MTRGRQLAVVQVNERPLEEPREGEKCWKRALTKRETETRSDWLRLFYIAKTRESFSPTSHLHFFNTIY